MAEFRLTGGKRESQRLLAKSRDAATVLRIAHAKARALGLRELRIGYYADATLGRVLIVHCKPALWSELKAARETLD